MGESWRLKLELEKRRFHPPTPTRNSNSILLLRAARRSRESQFLPRPTAVGAGAGFYVSLPSIPPPQPERPHGVTEPKWTILRASRPFPTSRECEQLGASTPSSWGECLHPRRESGCTAASTGRLFSLIPRGLPDPGIHVSYIGRRILYH